MSIDLVDSIHKRIKEELIRLDLKMSEAARAMGEENSQGLRDVCAGRKRATAEMVAKLALLSVDVAYVLTGERSNRAAPPDLPPDEQMLLESYRALPMAHRKVLLAELLTGTKVAVKPKRAGSGVSVEGNNNRVAGGDYNGK